eukprot:1584480-Pleurochrysis_carterae.AAC.1
MPDSTGGECCYKAREAGGARKRERRVLLKIERGGLCQDAREEGGVRKRERRVVPGSERGA